MCVSIIKAEHCLPQTPYMYMVGFIWTLQVRPNSIIEQRSVLTTKCSTSRNYKMEICMVYQVSKCTTLSKMS